MGNGHLLTVCALVLALACVVDEGLRRVDDRIAFGDFEGARRDLEERRELAPGSVDVRVKLGEVYYKLAREQLDRHRNEAEYLTWLEKSVYEFLAALELEPEEAQPHFFMGVMDTYRGEPHRALRSFRNALRLKPVGIYYTNIAEIYVYLGHRHKARYWNRQGLRRGAPRWAATFNEMLLTWKEGDLASAERKFSTLAEEHPDALRTINVARLPSMPADFREFASYCCRSPACGPYMENACRQLELEVYDEKLSKEAMLQELRIEMEKRRRLEEIYGQRKDLQIELEPLEEAR